MQTEHLLSGTHQANTLQLPFRADGDYTDLEAAPWEVSVALCKYFRRRLSDHNNTKFLCPSLPNR
ncbi:MAG: hypothetical protein WCA47_16490, partial [Terriglobales bacterium]